MKNILYLASQSSSRQQLLREVEIAYQVIDHNSDEIVDTRELDFFGQVLAIALHKMEHVVLPMPQDVGSDVLFVLTADSLVRTVHTNEIFGKPRDRAHAQYMLTTMFGNQIEVATGCCLEKRRWDGHHWQVEGFKHWATEALIEFWVPEAEQVRYLEQNPGALGSAGAGVLEAKGQRYFKSVRGSYTAALGLPVYELCLALDELGF